MSTKTVTISEIIEAATDAGEWVNGEFKAVVRNSFAGGGRKPSKAEFCDPDNPRISVVGVSFGIDLCKFEGALCVFAPPGIKAKNYRGHVEVTVGEKAAVNKLSDAPPVDKSGSPPAKSGALPGPGSTTPPPAAKPTVDPVVYFHREMSKQSLAYLHCMQYTANVLAKTKNGMTKEQQQACTSSLFIEGNRRGLFDKVPKLREESAEGVPFAFIPPAPPAEDPAVAEKAKAEAAAKAAEAARAAHEAAEAEKKRKQAELDEDVPF